MAYVASNARMVLRVRRTVIPAKAGIHLVLMHQVKLDSRCRGNDGREGMRRWKVDGWEGRLGNRRRLERDVDGEKMTAM